MSFEPVDRRAFLGMGGMALLCTLAGQEVRTDQGQIDVNALGPGEIFGEMALMTGARRAATVTTAEECELLSIGQGDFRRLLAASPDLAKRVHHLATERKSQLAHKLDEAAAKGDAGDQRHFFVRFLDQMLAKPPE